MCRELSAEFPILHRTKGRVEVSFRCGRGENLRVENLSCDE